MAWTDPKTWVDNVDVLSASNLNTHLRDNLLAMSVPQTFTHNWQATGGGAAIGNGTIDAQYANAGNLHLIYIKITFGSTTTAGTGAWTFNLPTSAWSYSSPGGTWFIHSGYSYDASGGTYTDARPYDYSAYQIGVRGASATTPFTWATSDELVVSGVFLASP